MHEAVVWSSCLLLPKKDENINSSTEKLFKILNKITF